MFITELEKNKSCCTQSKYLEAVKSNRREPVKAVSTVCT